MIVLELHRPFGRPRVWPGTKRPSGRRAGSALAGMECFATFASRCSADLERKSALEERLAISAQTREDLNAYHGVPAEMVRADPLCQFGIRTRPSSRRLMTATN